MIEQQNSVNNLNTSGKAVFIPPRKRQSVKKTNGILQQTTNYVDYIIPQGQNNLPHKQQFDDDKIHLEEDENIGEERNEMQVFHQQQNNYQNRSNFTVTPSSQSECSLDRQSSKSGDNISSNQSTKKRVNIKKPITPDYEGLESGDTSVMNADIEDEGRSRYLTMTGTIKRGKKKGQSIDVQLNISREELEKINMINLAAVDNLNNKRVCCVCSLSDGIHILLFTLVCFPIVAIYTSIYSFYIGTLTWYNMFTYFNEEKSCIYKFFMSPILILAYPFAIVLCTLGLGIYAGCVQVSCRFTKWINEICDIEKGFYGWLCGFMRLSDCSPYEVVILMDFQPPPENSTIPQSSTEELSL